MTKQINSQQIAIDGPAGSGKSTVAKLVAQRLGFDYLSTGKIFRAFYYLIKENNWSIDQLISNFNKYECAFNGDQVVINKENISQLLNDPTISKGASEIAQDPKIRAYALSLQQDYANKKPVVMDGRDITSVVLPNAILKVFLTASAQQRAIRRIKQLNLELNKATLEQFTNEIQQRDDNDTNRKLAPLMIVKDAIVIDSDQLSIEQVVDKIISLYKQRLGVNYA
ncbi:Cytidylate kinase [Mycoplasmoides gallisepticum str. R(low)]|uniref:Cytidylate kinase n=2 Tax=Mycoplasmoides gallisepticum TaxID=2096 RepID=KCY_MYCGA|nr:(d)CMP kinase [Mycoplasmoides gallisepticum]Q7NBV1.2 RecName: Full=Cytidylate kinase; Short=CK; AltName: Full=Cytidine monophosphate kinase; Short=CMP kinase [Mycoplasmoides gallisepticum str. R(low)]AAP56509.2 Cytidylate kinase [Mycoplasmoides gallisepticum str. R(low)]ADC30344.1 Cytidylate kinase [Mycoplasmoides gallisepticum str. R(high)]